MTVTSIIKRETDASHHLALLRNRVEIMKRRREKKNKGTNDFKGRKETCLPAMTSKYDRFFDPKDGTYANVPIIPVHREIYRGKRQFNTNVLIKNWYEDRCQVSRNGFDRIHI